MKRNVARGVSLMFALFAVVTMFAANPDQAASQAIEGSLIRVNGMVFPRVAPVGGSAAKNAFPSSCCQPGDTRAVTGVAEIGLSTPKGLAKSKYVPASGYSEAIYSPPLSCWVISTYSRRVTDANDPYDVMTDAQPAQFSYLGKTEYDSTLNSTKSYVAKLNILDKYKADLNAKLEEMVKSYSNYSNSISTSHGQVRHRARVQGRGAFNGSSWYKAHIDTTEICCPPEVRDAAQLGATLKKWVDETAAKLPSRFVADANFSTRYDLTHSVQFTTPQAASHRAALRSAGGSYMTAEGGGGSNVTCNRPQAGPWETFDLVDVNGGTLAGGDPVHVRASNGMYVVAEGGGGSAVNANRQAASTWETFTIVKVGGQGAIAPGDAVALRSSGGKYLAAENGGGSTVTCNQTAAGPWETFIYVKP